MCQYERQFFMKNFELHFVGIRMITIGIHVHKIR